MKRILLSVFCLSMLGFASAYAFVNTKSATGVVASELSVAQGWEYHKTVTTLMGIKRTSGGVTIKNKKEGRFSVETDGYNYRINFNGEYYSLGTSDRDEYTYMFYADGKYWYFNM